MKNKIKGYPQSVYITYKNIPLLLRKDCYIYEVYYKNIQQGYFHFLQLESAIKEITNDGYFDGFNYHYRLENLNLKII
jgi:hypothetical protein